MDAEKSNRHAITPGCAFDGQVVWASRRDVHNRGHTPVHQCASRINVAIQRRGYIFFAAIGIVALSVLDSRSRGHTVGARTRTPRVL
jgi:hypothetical protein